MSDTTSSNSSGIGFCGLLAIVFITLKLTHVIDWSWIWVLAPLWALPGLIISFLIVAALASGILLLAAGLVDLVSYLRKKRI